MESYNKINGLIDLEDIESPSKVIEEVPDEYFSDTDVEQKFSIFNEEDFKYKVPIKLLGAAKNILK